MLNRENLDKVICWYKDRTRPTRCEKSTYELTLGYLQLLRKLDRGNTRNSHTLRRFPDAQDVLLEACGVATTEEREVIKLTEREAQALFFIGADVRDLLEPKRNAKLIDALIKKGVLDHWREVTDEGRRALAAYRAG